jgi:hypothetical protein
VLGDESLEHAPRAPLVLATNGRADGRETHRARTVHRVAADRAERREAYVAAVRADADAVHPVPARDRDAPAACAPCPEHRKRVVADDGLGRPAAFLGFREVGVLLVREVEAGDEQDCEIGRSPDLGRERVDGIGARPDTDDLRVAERSSGKTEQGPVLANQRRVGLRASAVDREDGLQWTASATSRSSRPSTSSTWPISGCASNAFRASTGSRLSAARTVSRS